MFSFSPNAIQLDGSVISRQSSGRTLVSSGLPISSIVSSLREYLQECSGDTLVQNAIQAVINELEGSPSSNKTLALIFSRELVRILSIFLDARQSQQPLPSLKDFRQQLVGASGLSLSSYLAQFIIASAETDEELSSSTVAALITLVEVAVLLERRGSWPSKGASFIVTGASRPQILTASRMSDSSFSVPVILDTNTLVVKGPASNLPKLTAYIQQNYSKTIVAKLLKHSDDLPTALIVDFPHPTTPDFSTLMMEELPPVLMRLQGFISRNSSFPSERLLKIPLVSPFDGCVTGKSLVCQVRMVPSMGTPMFDAMIDFLVGRPIDLPLLRSTINFVLTNNKSQSRSLFVVSSTSESHEIQVDTTKPPSFEFDSREVPLNINQKMIALHQQRYPSSSIYNITDIVRVTGVVDKAKLIDAVQMVLIQHPSCTMTLKDNETAVIASSSVVRSMAEKSIFVHEPVKEEELMAAIAASTKVPFILSEPNGLLKVHIFPIANTNTTAVHVTIHHLASDGFSGFALPTRVIQFYTREDNFFWQLTHALRPSAVDVMLHFNACQTQLAQTNNTMKDFWTSKIASGEFDHRLDMLTSMPRGGAPTFNGAERIVKLESSLWEGLKNKSSELGSTRFHLLAAAWSIVVSRYSQQNKFNLGTAFHCRKEDWLDATIFTSNAMPVRVEVDHELSLKDFVSSLKKSVDSCKKNEEYPASALIKDILDTKKIVTAQGQSPLFQIEVNYYHMPSLPKLASKELVMKERIYPHYMQAGMTDLTAWFVTLNNGVILNIKYNTDLYKQDLIEQIESDLLNLLSLLVKSSADTKVNEIVRASGNSLVTRGRGPTRKGPFIPMFARVMNFGSLLDRSNNLAVADKDTSLTFKQLSTAARGIAKMIQSHVTGKHQVVAVLMDRSVVYTTSMLGIMSAGCVYLPLNSSDPIERIKGILTDARASVVITQQNKIDLLKDITTVKPLVISLDEVMKPVEVNLPVIGALDPCYMIFTSGTTGKPKGVVVPHIALSNLANEMSSSFNAVQGACLALFEFSFDAHLHDVVMSISRGCPLVISKPFGNKDPQYIIDTAHSFKVTTILMVPSMLSMILDYFDINASEKSKFSSVQLVGCGGEALYVKLVDRTKKSLPSVRVINNYGPTEACVLCSYYDCNTLPETRSANDVVPIGAPIRNSELLILGEDRNIVPVGVTGQLYIGGDCLALGYANNPQQTQAKFVDHPYAEGKRLYASGDLAKYLPSGEIHFLGRADNQIKLRGYRIECGEIESAILGCSGVKMSSVVVHKSEQRDQCLVGFVEFDSSINNESKVSHLTTVLGELKTKLPQYMVPTRLVAIDKFPLTSHGKVDTKQLPNPFEATYFSDQHAAGSTGPVKPLSTQVEKTIAKCFAEVLSIDQSKIGSNSNFFDLGGSSLHAFTLVNKISEALNVKLELKQFFDNASPGELAKLFDVQAAKQQSESSLERFKKKPLTHYECVKLKEATEAPATNIFLVHGAFRNGVVFKDVASKFPPYVTVYSFQDSTPLDVKETDDDHPSTMEEFADIYVKLLMNVQSSGIYHLAGYCFGGVLVCEMAHQMLQKGCNVCTVAMIDSTAPSIVNARGLSDISAPTIFRMISFEIAMALIGKTSDLTEEHFKHLKTPQQQKQALIDAFSDKIDKKILVPFVERALAHFASSSGLLTNYRFKPLRGRITLLSAQQKWALYNFYNPMGMHDLGWKTLHENIHVAMTPGDHLTIIRDSRAIDVVVDNLVKLLEQEGACYMRLPSVRETLNLQSVPTLDNLEKRVPNDLLRIDIPESGPINPVAAIHRAVYFSLMAPSGHNVQPWKIFIDETNLKIVLCLNKKRIPPFFLAVDSMSFYDRVGMGAAIHVMKQLLVGYGFQVTQQVLESNANLEMEPFMVISIAPAGAGTAKPAMMKRQQSLGAVNRPKMINSPASIPKQPNSPVMLRDGQTTQGSQPQSNQLVQAPKKMMGLPKRPVPGKVQHGEIRRSPSASVLSQNQSGPQVAAAGQEVPKQPSSPMLTRPIPSSQSSPNISRQARHEGVKQFESLVSQRVTNRHYYSKRRVVPMRTLQHLSNPALSQDPVRVLVINDPAQIKMLSRYVEDVETNSYISDCVRKGLIGNIGVQEEQRNHTIPLDALELGQMQLVTATKVVTMDQNTIMTLRAHKALGIATGQKIYNSAGLLVFVGPRDHSLNELTNALGATLISAMLKCTEYNIATQPWTTAFLLQRLLWPLNGRLSAFGEKIRSEVTEETPDFFEQLDLFRQIVPQIKDNEMPLIVVRFGYPDEEISGHSTRLPASESVTLIKRGDAVPNEIKTVLN